MEVGGLRGGLGPESFLRGRRFLGDFKNIVVAFLRLFDVCLFVCLFTASQSSSVFRPIRRSVRPSYRPPFDA